MFRFVYKEDQNHAGETEQLTVQAWKHDVMFAEVTRAYPGMGFLNTTNEWAEMKEDANRIGALSLKDLFGEVAMETEA